MMAKRTPEDRQHWQGLWANALKNIPHRVDRHGHEYGKWACLARLLDYPLYTKNGKFGGHNYVYGNWRRGGVPRNPETQRKLRTLAGPTGRFAARLKLMRMGKADWYQW